MARRALTWIAIGVVGTLFAGSLFAQVPIVGTPRLDSHGSGQALNMGPDGTPNIGSQSDSACSSVLSNCTMIALLKALLNGGTPSNPATVQLAPGALPLPVQPPSFSVPYTGSATSAATLFSFQPAGYASVMYQWTSEGTGNTTIIEQSLDGSNWSPLTACVETDTAPSVPSATFSPGNNSNILVVCPATPYQRARVSTYGSGTVTVNAIATMLQVPTSVSAPVGTGGNPIVSVASNNAQNVAKGAHTVMWVSLQNRMTSSPTTIYAGIYNTGGTPTCTNTPALLISVPAVSGQMASINLGPLGRYFSNGIGVCITADPAGAVPTNAGDAVLTVGYQ